MEAPAECSAEMELAAVSELLGDLRNRQLRIVQKLLCGIQGRLWVGAMANDQTHPNARGGGSFSCVARGEVLFSQPDYTIPNGLAFRKDGGFYHTDTATGGIDLCTFREDGGGDWSGFGF